MLISAVQQRARDPDQLARRRWILRKSDSRACRSLRPPDVGRKREEKHIAAEITTDGKSLAVRAGCSCWNWLATFTFVFIGWQRSPAFGRRRRNNGRTSHKWVHGRSSRFWWIGRNSPGLEPPSSCLRPNFRLIRHDIRKKLTLRSKMTGD